MRRSPLTGLELQTDLWVFRPRFDSAETIFYCGTQGHETLAGMGKMFRKEDFMEALLVLVSIAALLSTASGNLQVRQTPTTSITTYSTSTTASSYTLTTLLSTSVSTLSATFLSSINAYVYWTTYTSPIATVTNIVENLSTFTYPVVTVFIIVSAFTTSISSGFDSNTYIWILLALGIGLSAIVVLIVIVLMKRSPPAQV
jgi:hypothetical protein